MSFGWLRSHRSLDKSDVLRRIGRGEGQTIEFKETTGTLKDAVKTTAAFASQPEGGCVIIGVNDNGTLHKGFQIGKKTVEDVSRTIKSHTLSMVTAQPFSPKVHSFDAPNLLVIEVPKNAHKEGPYLAYGNCWKRVGKTTNRVVMDYAQLARAYEDHLWDNESEHHLGYRFCPRCGGEDLDRKEFADYDHDRLYHAIECKKCGWGDLSE